MYMREGGEDSGSREKREIEHIYTRRKRKSLRGLGHCPCSQVSVTASLRPQGYPGGVVQSAQIPATSHFLLWASAL